MYKKCIYLAHVLAAIFHSHIPDDQCPRVEIIVSDRQAIAVCNDVLMNCQNRLRIGFYPRDLHKAHQ